MSERVVRSQAEQKARWDQHAKERLFRPGDCVYAKNFAAGLPWLPGVIQSQKGPMSFVVELSDGKQVHRHQDHLQSRHATGGEGPQGVSHKDFVSSFGDYGMVSEMPVLPEVNHGGQNGNAGLQID